MDAPPFNPTGDIVMKFELTTTEACAVANALESTIAKHKFRRLKHMIEGRHDIAELYEESIETLTSIRNVQFKQIK